MNELAELQIRVKSLEVDKAGKRLDKLEKSGKRAQRATDGLVGSFGRILGPLAGMVSGVAALSKITNVTREFDVLNAQLITATGSAFNAGVAFEAIQDFASSTPYDLAQVTDGFTKLVNLGLTPSERALTSYGNTASAMGKDLNQLIEAVADAATGEFERLKEFGIKASSEGDRVSFTFRGMTTTVGKNAAEIEQYLQQLGENEFAGAMEQRMDTLDGALSNLADEWDKLFLNISEQGIGDFIEDTVRLAISWLEELNDYIKSGELGATLDALGSKFDPFIEDIKNLQTEIESLMEGSEDEIGGVVDFIINAFRYLPENIRAFIQILTVDLASGFDEIKASATLFKDSLAAIFTDDTVADSFARFKERQAQINAVRDDSIAIILKERDEAIAGYDAKIEKSKEVREAYEEEKKAKAAANEGVDRLANFGVGGSDSTGEETESKEEKRKREAAEKAFARLEEDLRTEEEAIQDSYNRRLQMILDNTQEGGEKRAELLEKLNAQFREDALGDLAAPDTYAEQLAALDEYYQNRLELIRNNTQLEEEERLALEMELGEQRKERQQQLENARNEEILADNAMLFEGLAGLAEGFAGKQSNAYKGLFAVSKAFSIAQATMSIATGLAKAQELGFPANIGEMARVAATGAGIVSQISGSNFSGAYDKGGSIGAGKWGIVGEYGPEIVEGPANVTSRRDTAAMAREAMGGSAAPQVTVQNIVDPSLVLETLQTPEGEDVVKNLMTRNRELL